MSQYLISTLVTYRVDTEEEAKQLIEENKINTVGNLTKYSCNYKNQKAKGEIIQEWYEVTMKTIFNDEKDPLSSVRVYYEV